MPSVSLRNKGTTKVPFKGRPISLINLIEPSLGGISKNELWALQNSYVLASPKILETRTPYDATKKITFPLNEEVVLSN